MYHLRDKADDLRKVVKWGIDWGGLHDNKKTTKNRTFVDDLARPFITLDGGPPTSHPPWDAAVFVSLSNGLKFMFLQANALSQVDVCEQDKINWM